MSKTTKVIASFAPLLRFKSDKVGDKKGNNIDSVQWPDALFSGFQRLAVVKQQSPQQPHTTLLWESEK
jgi:hypothetical protein